MEIKKPEKAYMVPDEQPTAWYLPKDVQDYITSVEDRYADLLLRVKGLRHSAAPWVTHGELLMVSRDEIDSILPEAKEK